MTFAWKTEMRRMDDYQARAEDRLSRTGCGDAA
jgi:hypothetical protein